MPILDCGIDIGSTNVKVVFVGEDGRAVWVRSIPSPRSADGFGPVTDAVALVATLEDLIIEGWQEQGGGAPLRSITAAGVGEDGIGIGDDLVPTGHALAWFDKRATEEVERLKHHFRSNPQTGIDISTERTAAKWLWIRKHRPQELASAKFWITLTDFPAVWWSGIPFMSCSLAPRTGCYDVYNRRWIDALLVAAQAPHLPPVLHAGETVGHVRKGRLRDSGAASAETILVAGGHDHPVAAAMIRRFEPHARVDSMGTANLIYGEFANTGVAQKHGLIAFSVPANGSNDISCMGALELSAALAVLQDDAESLRAFLAARRLPGSPPSSLLDLQNRSRGRDTRTRRGLEMASLEACHLMEAMGELGVPDGGIYATGGWSRSHAFVELRASMFGKPVNVVGDMELVSIGAACFGIEAATGKSICPIRQDDMIRIEPITAWQSEYRQVCEDYKRDKRPI